MTYGQDGKDGKETFFSLGARLSACADLVREGKVMADIGTDHAYLPIWLIHNGRIPRAYASDIHEEPIQSANANIQRYGLSDKVITLTADGLAKIPHDEVDDIVIAGMGGDNIAAILEAAPWLTQERYRLILQPMSRAERLREYLYQHGFEIQSETPVCEANRIYTVIYAAYSAVPLPIGECDCYIGRLDPRNAYAVKLLQKQAAILRSVADGMAAQGDVVKESHYRNLSEQILRYAKREESEEWRL